MTPVSQPKGLRHIGAALVAFSCLTAASFAEAPRIANIEFDGEMPFSAEYAREKIPLKRMDRLTPEKAQAAAEMLRDAARERYYPLARVTWEATHEHQEHLVNLMFRVDPGPRGRVREVRFTGLTAFSDEPLRKLLTVTPARTPWTKWTKQDALILEDLEKDHNALIRFYHRHGYAAVRIEPAKLERPSRLDGIRVTWPIVHEGPVYTVGYIGLDTDLGIVRDVLEPLIFVRSGERYNADRVRQTRNRLETFLLKQGYAFASVQVDTDRLDDDRRVDLVFRIDAGTRPRLREIAISGNESTQRRIIEREIDVHAGMLFSYDALQKAQNRLASLPLFSNVVIDYDGSAEADVYDLRVEVEERKTGRLEVGVMYGETESVVGQLNLQEMNLSLRPPFRGDALQGRLGAMGGSRILKGSVGLFNPRIGASHWSLDGSAFVEDSTYVSDEYDQRTAGAQLLLGHPLGSHFTVHTGLNAVWHELYNIEEAYADDPRLTDDVRLTAWVLSLKMDWTDRLLRPTRGVRLRGSLYLGSRAFGGDTETVQSQGEAAFYYSPWREHVLQLRGGLRNVDAYGQTESVPAPLRLYLGGVNNLRGFTTRSVSPKDEQERLTGGLCAWSGTLAYMIPIFSRLDVEVYFDIGDVTTQAYRFQGEGPVSNWGVGFLLRADNFPVRIDVAFPMDTYENDTSNRTGEHRLSFSAGYRY